jgi:hypothetical protein
MNKFQESPSQAKEAEFKALNSSEQHLKFSFYLTKNRLHLHYKYQVVRNLYGNNRSLFGELY